MKSVLPLQLKGGVVIVICCVCTMSSNTIRHTTMRCVYGPLPELDFDFCIEINIQSSFRFCIEGRYTKACCMFRGGGLGGEGSTTISVRNIAHGYCGWGVSQPAVSCLSVWIFSSQPVWETKKGRWNEGMTSGGCDERVGPYVRRVMSGREWCASRCSSSLLSSYCISLR